MADSTAPKPVSPAQQPSVAVGFDRVLADYHGWVDDATIGGPRPGAREFMQRLKKRGYNVVVVSGRVRSLDDASRIARWLDNAKIPYDSVWAEFGVPSVVAYVDDHNVHIPGNPSNGDFNAALAEITNREDRVR